MRTTDPPPRSPELTLHTLGECRIAVAPTRGPAATLAPDADRLFSLALLLAAEPGRPLARGQAAEWLWPEAAPRAARRCLRQALYRLRAFGVPVAADADHLCLPRAAVAPTFAAAPSVAALRAGWQEASLRLGRVLPGWAPAGDALRAWADDYRARIEGAARRALDAMLDGTVNAGCAPGRGAPCDATLDDAGADPDAAGAARGGPPVAVLARALLELDPEHPRARRLAHGDAGRAVALREGPAPAYGPAAHGAHERNVDDPPDESLWVLEARLTAARAGAGGLVVLAGPPGNGPSALLAAFSERVSGARVVWVDCAATVAGPRTLAAGLRRALARALLACPGGAGLHLASAFGGGLAPPSAEQLGRLGAAVAAAGPVVVCVDRAELAGAAALGAVAEAAGAWAAVPALVVVACAGAWPRQAGPAPAARRPREGVGPRWGARLAEVAAAVADGRPLLVRVDALA